MPTLPEQNKLAQPTRPSASVKVARKNLNATKNGEIESPVSSGKRQPNFHPFAGEIAATADEMLQQGMRHLEKQLNSKLLTTVRECFGAWLGERAENYDRQLKATPKLVRKIGIHSGSMREHRRLDSHACRLLCEFVPGYIESLVFELEQLKNENREFRQIVSRVNNDADLRHVILDYAAQLGATDAQLKQDKKSLDLWLDEEAMNDRFLKQTGELELLVVFALDRLSIVVAKTFQLARSWQEESNSDSVIKWVEIWGRLNLENRIVKVVRYQGDVRLPVAALKCLRKGLHQLVPEYAAAALDEEARVVVNRLAMDTTADVWLQCEAISICAWLDQYQGVSFLQHRARIQHGTDDIFVRRHIWRLLTAKLKRQPRLLIDFENIEDPSPFVRQAIAETAIWSQSVSGCKTYLALGLHDEVKQVRAATLTCAIGVDLPWESSVRVLNLIDRVLRTEKDPFVIRTAFHVSVVLLEKHRQQSEAQFNQLVEFYQAKIEPAIRSLETQSESTPVRRWAAQTGEKIWAILDPRASEMIKEVHKSVSRTNRGKIAKIPNSVFKNQPEDVVGRALSVLAIDDFGYEVQRGRRQTRIRRGDHFGFRLWRFWFEFFHTATDKRQAIRHTTGRISTSSMRIPSQICGELSETKVPGEPLTISSDGTWRPFLPLLDDFISLLNMSWLRQGEMNFYSSQGITRVKGPNTWAKRMKAFYNLSFQFAKLAKLRNWNDDSFPPHRYIDSLRGLGFEISFERYSDGIFQRNGIVIADDSVEKFFRSESDERKDSASPTDSSVSAAAIVVAMDQSNLIHTISQTMLDFASYFYSPFENTLPQLVVFTVIMLLLFMGRHFLDNYRFRKARRKIPLSIGGWGTRGKSGTERLKAALLGVMGHGLVSKTTGCEAMFIHGVAHGEPLEIPFFRPYDKATIWEQKNLIVLASKMNPSVFLWECMALTPAYVDVLQRQWTQDDLGTITNTYPDHEDVQGPAGHNVATTISGFVPQQSHLLTTERQMLPFVSESCRHAETSLEGIGWLESGLITDDVLDRFPYREHPDNIALVAAMGTHLGCEYDYSLKAMADLLVPDLGVLKTHPISTIKHRKIEFTNGCSANERFGCMGNWKRLGFDSQDPWTEPDTWICGVVNNRADRVPRSKVFAKIIVEDVNADRFFLIGNNLDGLQSFIDEALREKVASMSLKQRSGDWDREHALESLKQAAWDLRLPTTNENVQDRLQAMLRSVCPTNHESIDLDNLMDSLLAANVAEALVQRIVVLHEQSVATLAEYQELRTTVEAATTSTVEAAEEAFRNAYVRWYQQKIVVVPKYESTGEEVIAKIVEEVPPGFLAKVMGLQNIKGTGLDFVYRFQAWDRCHEACKMMTVNNAEVAQKGLNALLAMPEIGQLCQELVAETITCAQKNPAMKRVDLQKQLGSLQEKLDRDVAKTTESISDDSGDVDRSSTQKMKDWIIDNAEQYLDVNDSLQRREHADLIYRELAACRISRQRAIMEMRKINKRQKGGWLKTANG